MLNELMSLYEQVFNEEIELIDFIELDEDEQIKILKECLNKKQRIYENEYFNDNYMEEVI